MAIIIILFFIGLLVGVILDRYSIRLRHIDRIANMSIMVLLFLLGTSIGGNKLIISKLDTLGLNAFIFAISSIIGSALLTKIFYPNIKKS